ncbi:MAG: cell division protein ZapA [Rhizomicrobium sp.]|jgi:cell division protein ZapA
MAQVDVTVNDRSYRLTCDPGQEDHLRELAAHVDDKVSALAESVGQVGEARLLLMAALLITEDYKGTVQRLEAQAQAVIDLAKAEESAAGALNAAAKRVEDIAGKLAAA